MKGSASLSKYLTLPDNMILDYMHLSCLGTVEKLLTLWLYEKYDQTNIINPWFLGIINYSKCYYEYFFI